MLLPARIKSLVLACTLIATSSAFLPAHAIGQKQAKVAKDTKAAKDNDAPVRATQIKHPVLWHQPADISSLDLFSGLGGEDKAPLSPFTFLAESKHGTNPKMDVSDANGTKWRVKTGEESRPEVVASRLLWATGFYANVDYVLPEATVDNVNMERGTKEVKAGNLTDARFERKPGGQNKIGIWEWKTNPFYGSREFNGLRVMMAVMNNWDLKDENNAVYQDKKTGSQIYLISDVGATFGANGLGWSKARSKGNVDSFKESKFVQSMTATDVSFYTPKKPTGILVATLGATAKSYSMRKDLDWIGNDIPRKDARWMGDLLGQLSHKQLVDAFRAGAFPQEDIDAYVDVIESRITALKGL